MTIDVLGCGESVQRYIPNENKTIGVNYIFKWFNVDYLLSVDKPPIRGHWKEDVLLNSTPKVFYYYNPLWEGWFDFNKNVKQQKIDLFILSDLDSETLPYSNNSTFVACVLAYKLGAKIINLYGADFNTHPNLSFDFKKERIKRDFAKLRKQLEAKGCEIYVTKESILSSVLVSF